MSKPCTTGLRFIFAAVTLFLGWLLAIVIPMDSPTAANWAIHTAWLSRSKDDTHCYLNGTGQYVGQVPTPVLDDALEAFDESGEPVVSSSADLANRPNDRFQTYDPGTRRIVPGDSSAREDDARSKVSDKASDKASDKVVDKTPGKAPDKTPEKSVDKTARSETPDGMGTDTAEAEWGGGGGQVGEAREREEQWAREVKTAPLEDFKFKKTTRPEWTDTVAAAPSSGGDSAKSKDQKAPKDPKAPKAVAKSTDPKGGASVEARSSDATAVGPNLLAASEPVKTRRPGDVPDVLIKTGDRLVDPPTREKYEPFTPLSETAVSGAPALRQTEPAANVASASRQAEPERTETPVPPELSGRLIVNPDASGEHWKAPRTVSAASLIPSRVDGEQARIASTNYSTTVPRTVSVTPQAISFPSVRDVHLVQTPQETEATRQMTVSRIVSSTPVALPSSSLPVRISAPTAPEDFARTRNMSETAYKRFIDINGHKLDGSGRFPAQTLLLVPE